LVADLNIKIDVIGCETLREADGLAMSSRNARLSPQARAAAPALNSAMTGVVGAITTGKLSPQTAIEAALTTLYQAGFERVEYIALHDGETMLPSTDLTRPLRLLAAAWIGGVRLIDNIAVAPAP